MRCNLGVRDALAHVVWPRGQPPIFTPDAFRVRRPLNDAAGETQDAIDVTSDASRVKQAERFLIPGGRRAPRTANRRDGTANSAARLRVATRRVVVETRRARRW